MKIALSRRLQRQLEKLPDPLAQEFHSAAEQLPRIFGNPHAHGGLGIRKLHRRRIYEFRVGRQWRVVFSHPEPDVIFLHIIGTHAEVQRFLDSL